MYFNYEYINIAWLNYVYEASTLGRSSRLVNDRQGRAVR